MTTDQADAEYNGRAETGAGANHISTDENESKTRISENLAASPWVRRLAKLGYAAKGFLYVIVGATAALAAIDVGGRPRGLRGALDLVAGQPFGRVGLALVAVGLAGFILRRFVQILVPPEGSPKLAMMRFLRPIGYFFSGLANVGILLTALQMTLGWRVQNARGERSLDWTAFLTDRPFGGWLVFFAGLVIVGIAVFHFYLAITTRFQIDLQVERMSDGWRKIVFLSARLGYAARGAAFLITGGILVYAGWFVEQSEINGIGGALQKVEAIPFGTILLALIAAGFIAYGLYLIFVAKYLRLIASW